MSEEEKTNELAQKIQESASEGRPFYVGDGERVLVVSAAEVEKENGNGVDVEDESLAQVDGGFRKVVHGAGRRTGVGPIERRDCGGGVKDVVDTDLAGATGGVSIHIERGSKLEIEQSDGTTVIRVSRLEHPWV